MSLPILLVIQQQTEQGFFETVGARMEEGGLFIMSLIMICGLMALFLLGRGLVFTKKQSPKIGRTIILINSIGLFALVLGVFGQLLKLISTLDYLSAFEDTTPRDLADGLKITLLPTLFGTFIFLFTRFSTILLNWIKPHSKSNTQPNTTS